MSTPDILEHLAAHRTIGSAPREELEWLASHGTLDRFETGAFMARRGEPVGALYIVLSGRIAHLSEHGGTWRKVMDWRGGDVTGQLPYSRMNKAPGNSVVEEAAEVFQIARKDVEQMPTATPHVTAELVHVMIDRARAFKSSDVQAEKMASLGKLAAGLAHELNNPASAAARSATLVMDALNRSDDAARALGAAGLDTREIALIDRVRAACVERTATRVLSPLERADREEAFADWLSDHDVDDTIAESLADTEVDLVLLDELAAALSGDKLSTTLRWVATGCTIRGLARDVERAARRVHELVRAVKGLTYMDRATVPEPVDISQGLADTVSVLGAKAKGRSVAVSVDAPTDLPRIRGFGGELGQVWINLVDNAIDAVSEGGRVSVSARAEGASVVVRVADDGPGIPAELQSKIFDPFFTTKTVGKGTGLGLDIARRLVEQNGGRIDVDSQPGRTEFRVALPVAD